MDDQTIQNPNNEPFITDTLTLRKTIRDNQGKPIYIVDEKPDIIKPLLFGGVVQICYVETIHKALQDDKSNPEGAIFGQPMTTKDTDSPVIILSNDHKATRIYEALQGANVTVYRQDPSRPFTPIVCSGRDSVKAEIVNQYRNNYSVGGNIGDFANVINSNVNTPAIKTDFDVLDKVIDGGLYEGLYTIGAISSLGKTTFCINVADQVAKQGKDVIILSLEMSKYQIMSKSISRLTFCRYQNVEDDSIKYEWCKTSRGITDGSRYQNYCPEELSLIKQATEIYAKDIGNHLFIYEAVGDMTVDQARAIIKQHIEYTGNRPVVIVDYLQLLQHPDKYINGNDKLRTDVNITSLKRTSRDFKVPIILISSLNRVGYDKPVTFESFKESGAIEYSSDVVIGLQLAGVGRTDFDVIKAKQKDPREIELTILKNREGKIGQLIKYSYYPMFNHFIEDGLVEG